mmetsp:Transcript_28700/g.50514  ORF Transcript_28700/g.50514 Transcript_28700/m.50514 type:complete len:288 (-) Transcript_28700:309-1172(-)
MNIPINVWFRPFVDLVLLCWVCLCCCMLCVGCVGCVGCLGCWVSTFVPLVDEEVAEKKKRKRKRTKKSSYGAAVLSDSDDDDEAQHVNPHATAELEEPEEQSDSDIDDMFKEMQQAASKASRASGRKANPGKKEKTKKKKKKRLKIPGINFSAPVIDFGDDEDESYGVNKADETVEVKQVKQFAGETVVVKKKVAVGSKEAKKFKKKTSLDKLLSNLKGKNKINTLDKCQLDWEKDKEKEGDAEELQIASRNGELEKKQFLLQTDYKQFEIERDARNEERRKRGVIL